MSIKKIEFSATPDASKMEKERLIISTQIFILCRMYLENPEGTQEFLGTVNMGYEMLFKVLKRIKCWNVDKEGKFEPVVPGVHSNSHKRKWRQFTRKIKSSWINFYILNILWLNIETGVAESSSITLQPIKLVQIWQIIWEWRREARKSSMTLHIIKN